MVLGAKNEKSGVITDYWTDNLLDLILRKENLNKVYKQVKSNKGSGRSDLLKATDEWARRRT